MRGLYRKLALILTSAGILWGCFTSSGEAPCEHPYWPEGFVDDTLIVRALLDSNGLTNKPAYGDVLTQSGGCEQSFSFVLRLPAGMRSFRFIPEIANLKIFNSIAITGSDLETLPEGIRLKKWNSVIISNTRICSLSREDSLYLAQYDKNWYSGQFCQ